MPSADKHVPFEMNAWRSGLRGVHSKLTMPLSDMLGLSHFIHTTYHKHARYGARQHPSPSAVQVRQLVVAHDESCAERRHHATSRGARAMHAFAASQCSASGAGLSRPAEHWGPPRQRCRSFTAHRGSVARAALLGLAAELPSTATAVPVFHGPQTAGGAPMLETSRGPKRRAGTFCATSTALAALLRRHRVARSASKSLMTVLQVPGPEFGTPLALATSVAGELLLVGFGFACQPARQPPLARLQRLALLVQDAPCALAIPPIVLP